MWSGPSVDDLCIDYKLKFGIHKKKIKHADTQLGFYLTKASMETYKGTEFEYYLHISFFQWRILIGWFLEKI